MPQLHQVSSPLFDPDFLVDLGPMAQPYFQSCLWPFLLPFPAQPPGCTPDLFCFLHLGLLTALPATRRCCRTVTWSVRALPAPGSCSAPGVGPLLLLSGTVIQETSLPNTTLSLLFWAGPASLLKFQIWKTVTKQRSSKIKRRHLTNQSYNQKQRDTGFFFLCCDPLTALHP